MNLHEFENRKIQVVDTISDRKGGVKLESHALIGFDCFEEADGFAKEHGLMVVLLYREFGQELWYNDGEEIDEAPKLSSLEIGYDWSSDEGLNFDILHEKLVEEVQFTKDFQQIAEFAFFCADVASKLNLLHKKKNLFVKWDTMSYLILDLHPTSWYDFQGAEFCIAVCDRKEKRPFNLQYALQLEELVRKMKEKEK